MRALVTRIFLKIKIKIFYFFLDKNLIYFTNLTFSATIRSLKKGVKKNEKNSNRFRDYYNGFKRIRMRKKRLSAPDVPLY